MWRDGLLGIIVKSLYPCILLQYEPFNDQLRLSALAELDFLGLLNPSPTADNASSSTPASTADNDASAPPSTPPPPPPPASSLDNWLCSLDLEQYCAVMADQRLQTTQELRGLWEEEYSEMGVLIGDRIKIKKALSELG